MNKRGDEEKRDIEERERGRKRTRKTGDKEDREDKVRE